MKTVIMTSAEETVAGTTAGAGGAETEIVVVDYPPTGSTLPVAWSAEDGTEESGNLPLSWRSALFGAAVIALCGVVAAVIIVGLGDRSGGRAIARPAPTHSAPTAMPAAELPPISSEPLPPPPVAARPDDDEFVAIAISSLSVAVNNVQHAAGFGTSGTQQNAEAIALRVCAKATEHTDCVLATPAVFHGCVSIAMYDQKWSSGIGDSQAAAVIAAKHRLGSASESASVSVAVECSTPPGANDPTDPQNDGAMPLPTQAPTARPEAAPTMTPAPAPQASAPDPDTVFRNFVLRIPGVKVTNWALTEAGAHKVCAYLGAGHTRDDTVQQVLANDPTFTVWQASAMVNASTTAYCPE